jgi:hypothetical protein
MFERGLRRQRLDTVRATQAGQVVSLDFRRMP